MNTLVCLDRDGTITEDKNYYLGSQENWKELVEFREGVIEGIKLLNSKGYKTAIITAQAGVARKDKPLLDEKRMREVNDYIVNKLKEKGAIVDNSQICPYVDEQYKEKYKELVDENYIDDKNEDIKPRTGMIKNAKKELIMEEAKVYVIGDRYSDVLMAVNAGGKGILVSGHKTDELGDKEKVKLAGQKIADNFYKACLIITKENK